MSMRRMLGSTGRVLAVWVAARFVLAMVGQRT